MENDNIKLKITAFKGTFKVVMTVKEMWLHTVDTDEWIYPKPEAFYRGKLLSELVEQLRSSSEENKKLSGEEVFKRFEPQI
jgi:hypothetical protein